jgi:predicted ATPase/DNA-binding winged helix-turn-helix (wHTH) protein
MTGTRGDQKGVAFGPFRLFPAERRLERDGRPVEIGSRAFDLLVVMAERAGEVIPKAELLARAWPGMTIEESGLRFHISVLRKVLQDGRDGARYIANIPSRGYCLVVTPTPIPGAAAAPGPEAGEGASPAPPGATLPGAPPVPAAAPLGRDEAILGLLERLRRDRMVTVSGPAGIGKTTVALAVAAAERERGAQEVRIVDLAALQDQALVGAAVAAAFRISAQSEDPTNEILRFLADRAVLLVLDNCEHVLPSVAPLAERLHLEAPSVSILATSREPLRIAGEQVVELPPLPAPPDGAPVSLAEVLAYPATKLFLDRAGASGFQDPLTEDMATLVAALCRKLDGIALAIELVASRVGMLGIEETAALIDTRLRLSWQGRRTAPSRHQTLTAALDWSHDLLSEEERSTLRRLAVFVGPFSLGAAIAVAAEPGNEAGVAAALDLLVGKSLVSVRRGQDVMRYRLLDTTRAYGAVRLESSGEAAGTARRHAEAVLAILREGRLVTPSADRMARQATEQTFLGDVHAALRWSFAEGSDRTLSVALAAEACELFIRLSLLHECRLWASQALALAPRDALDDRTALKLHSALGHALTFTEGNGDATRLALEEALRLAEQLGDREEQFRLLSRLHMYHRRTDEISRLLPIALRMQELAAGLGDPAGIAASYSLIGLSLHLAGDQDGARVNLETALGMGEYERVAHGHFAYHRSPYIALARTLWLQGCPEQAIRATHPLLAGDEAPEVVTRCIGLIWGADVLRWTGEWATFQHLTNQLDALAGRYSLRPYQAVALGMRGEALIRAGQFRAGTGFLKSALRVLRAQHYELYTASFTAALAEGLAALGHADEAEAILAEAIAAAQAGGGGLYVAELHRLRGALHAARDETGSAEACFRQAIEIARTQGALSWELRAATDLARLVGKSGQAPLGAALLRDLLARFAEGFATPDLQQARRELERLEILPGLVSPQGGAAAPVAAVRAEPYAAC